ncbi:hypothetical protein [Paenibacillus sp. Soil522]|uniref:hypothetical protein n=1 Tax=Paenibacillus sp. Soil522 TaxID=1736388 RepID=UPI0007023176|nr:hypothetical protein [Paenibacillus sp. Soil522]KRE38684.1 hypothetical protein ASG81_19915 [Paenibacillus sp. Soil522]
MERVAIKGEGVIDGQGQAWWAAYQRLKQGEKEGISPYRDELIEQNAHLYLTMDSTYGRGFVPRCGGDE